MVGFQSSRSMGETAAPFASSNYRQTITAMKRLIGRSFHDPAVQAEIQKLPFECVESKNGGVAVQISNDADGDDKIVPMEHVAGMMVQHMGSIASAAAGDGVAVADWVIAVPGYYTDAQKRAMLAGCEMVGITHVLRLMHEHTATALAYGIFKDIRKEFTDNEQGTNVLFIDMGCSAYSATVCTFIPGKLIVKSHQFDANLGGRDFDRVIAEWINAKFVEKYGSKLSCTNPISKPKIMLKMMAAAEKAKKTLSPAGVKEARINLECLMDDLDFNIALTAEEYAELCAPLLARLVPPIERALAEAQISIGGGSTDLHSVEIVGGGTRVSSVKIRLAEVLQLDQSGTNYGLSTTMNADEAVARGAALQAAILSPRFKVKSYEIVEAQTYPIQLQWDPNPDVAAAEESSNSNSVLMFDRGSNFPVTKRVTLKKAGAFTVTARYPGNTETDNGTELAKFVIHNPSKELVKIRVNVKSDIHGIVSLSSAQMLTEVEDEVDPQSEANNEESKEGETKVSDSTTAATTTSEDTAAATKKKTKKTNIENNVTIRPLDWTQTQINEYHELEVAMANTDRIVKETADMRNELESYIYAMRDRILSGGDLHEFGTEDEVRKFSGALEEFENWLYEDGFDAVKSVYAEKLKALKSMGDPMEHRSAEAQARPAAMNNLQSTVERYKKWVTDATADESYAHISDEEKSQCHKKCDDVSSWMYDMLDKQGSVPVTADPVVTVAQINTKVQELMRYVTPIMNKPKPAPAAPKKEEVKEGSENASSEPAADTTTSDMDVETTAESNETGNNASPAPMETD